MSDRKIEKKHKVAVFITGGTILCAFDADSGKVTPTYRGQDLIDCIPEIREEYDLDVVELFHIPGSELTLQHGLMLAEKVKEKLNDQKIEGAVVVQGTDTIDEMSYLFNLLIDTSKPIVFTGSMKSFHDLYSDVKGNLIGAIRVAGNEQAKGRGTMVFFNEMIFSAADINKANANRVDAFQSFFGPIGIMNKSKVEFSRIPEKEEKYNITEAKARVEILKVYSGMSSYLLESAIAEGVDGIVLEAYGSGNIPSYIVPSVKEALERGIYVIVTTRCFSGTALGEYNYEGGGKQLESMNVMFGGSLSSQKARIKLIVLLAAGKKREQIYKAFGKTCQQ